jgi:UDP-N-acetylmuramyl pentapeptide phosphotransferase/UDP-N-acetylglucosamine-1-phosphate transferase
MLPALRAGLLAPVLSLVEALGLCTMLHLLALKVFPRLGLLDRPERYGLSRCPLPYPTGILSIATFILLFLLLKSVQGESLTFQDQGLLLCIGLLALTTLLDDLYDLPAFVRLGMQVLLGFLLFATGTRIYTITNPLDVLGIGGPLVKLDTITFSLSALSSPLSALLGPLPLWSGIFTITWIILTTNAFNWFDGIPGQVSFLSVIGGGTLGLLALSSRVNQPEIAHIAFLLAGCALGSALFDFPPNRVVMGDTGAMFFGLMLGTLSIYAGGKVATAFLVLGLPLLDALIVIARRILRGHSPFMRDLDHLHHRLVRKGWSEREVLGLTLLIGVTFGTTALFLSTFQKFLAILLLAILMGGLTWYSARSASAPPAPRMSL